MHIDARGHQQSSRTSDAPMVVYYVTVRWLYRTRPIVVVPTALASFIMSSAHAEVGTSQQC